MQPDSIDAPVPSAPPTSVMDGSNNDGNEGGGRRNLAYTEKFKGHIASMSQDAKMIADVGKPYREEARAQMELAIPEPATYQRILGIHREKLIAHGEVFIAGIAGLHGHSLEQSQVQAVADSLVQNARSTAMIEWALFAGTAALVFRQRHKIPPQVLARGGNLARFLWPPAVFTMYYIPVAFVIKPFFQVSNAAIHAKRLQADPRVKDVVVDIGQALQQHRANRAGAAQDTQSGSTPSQRIASQGVSWSDYSNKGDSAPPSYSAPKDWGQDTQSQSGALPPQQTHAGWDDDDASPIAPSVRGTPTDAGLSTWDRIRNETITRQGPPRSQSRQPEQSQGSGGWGIDSGSRASYSSDYSFPSSGQAKDDSKDQAQREFDQLVDRERHGSGQGQNSWGRR